MDVLNFYFVDILNFYFVDILRQALLTRGSRLLKKSQNPPWGYIWTIIHMNKYSYKKIRVSTRSARPGILWFFSIWKMILYHFVLWYVFPKWKNINLGVVFGIRIAYNVSNLKSDCSFRGEVTAFSAPTEKKRLYREVGNVGTAWKYIECNKSISI